MAYPLSALVTAGYSACDLLQAAFTPQQLRSEHVQLHDIIAALPLAHYALHAGYCYRCVLQLLRVLVARLSALQHMT